MFHNLIQVPSLVIFYTLSCASLGVFLLHRVMKGEALKRYSALSILAIGFILGGGVISAIWLLLALAGWFKLSVVLVVLGVSLASGIVYMRLYFLGVIGQIKNIWHETRSDSWGWQWIALSSVVLMLMGIAAMGAPWAGDAIAIYLATPKVLASVDRLVLIPRFEAIMSVGVLGEMHVAALMKLDRIADPIAYKMFSWFVSIATATMLLSLCAKVGVKRRGQWLALAAYGTTSAVTMMLGDGKIDIIAAATGMAAYLLALEGGSIAIIGLLTGFAGFMKLSYLGTMLPGMALLLIWRRIKGVEIKQLNRAQVIQYLRVITIDGLQLLGFCILAFIPQFIKNGILLGAPFAPIGFSGDIWIDQVWFNPQTTLRILLTYPVALTFGRYWAQGGDLSPIFLAFLPLALAIPRPKRWFASPLVAIILAGVLGMVVWLIRLPSVLSPRYYLATLLIFYPLAVKGAEYMLSSERSPRLLTFSIMLCVIVVMISAGVSDTMSLSLRLTKDYFRGNIGSCERESPWMVDICQVQDTINREAQMGERVYLASYYRYWLRPDLLLCTNNLNESGYVNSPTPAEWWLNLYERGFRYLMVDGSLGKIKELSNPPEWVKLTLLEKSRNVAAYRLDFINPPGRVGVSCQKIDQIWEVKPQ